MSDGIFSCNVITFGFRNAPATFRRFMNRVVARLEGVTVNLDGVVFFVIHGSGIWVILQACSLVLGRQVLQITWPNVSSPGPL